MIVIRGNRDAAGALESVYGVIAKIEEWHSLIARAYSRELLERLSLAEFSDDFLFDNQILAQTIWLGYTVAEVSCPTKYFPEASSINFLRSIKYGFGCLATALRFRLAKMGVMGSKLFRPATANSVRVAAPTAT